MIRTTMARFLLIALAALPAGAQVASFELSIPGPMSGPGPDPEGWLSGAGTLTVVPYGPIAGPTSGFPTDNIQCAIVKSLGASGNLPTSPAGVMLPLPLPAGASARLRHPISIPSGGSFSIQFDWNYVSTECPNSAGFNDFFTVDLTSGAGTRLLNLLYVDTYSAVMTTNGAVTPDETGTLWPFPCVIGYIREAMPVGAAKTTTVVIPSSLNGQSVYFEVNVADVNDVSFFGYAWIDDIRILGGPAGPLSINLAQPLGPGSARLVDTGTLPGMETFNAVSLEPAPGGVGTGPYLGLWTADINNLLAQILTPIGTAPFHVLPTSPTYVFGPISGVPSGLTVEAVAFEWNGSTIGRVSSVTAMTTQ